MISLLLLFEFMRRRVFLILWISLVLYIFYNSFTYYLYGRQFQHLRTVLGLGLCISRGTATVLNLSCALVLLPLCKKLNQILYCVLSKLCPTLFFFWLEKAKSFHMTMAITIVLFSVIHSCSHIANMWNFSRNEAIDEINFAGYKNENPLLLLTTQPGLTGIIMLIIILAMGATSMRRVRRNCYNAFWYTHQLYSLFLMLLLLHPLRGVLKQQILDDNGDSSRLENKFENSTNILKFTSIKSQTWTWMAFPLSCFFVDLSWRLISRNRSRVLIKEVKQLPGRVISISLIRLNQPFRCRKGQYVLLQCLEISRLEWHPFTVVKIPSTTQEHFQVWIRVKGDWTEELEKLLHRDIDVVPNDVNILLDGPYSSPMEGVNNNKISICIAAGVGITPFVTTLYSMIESPRSVYPGRVHLIWIVRHEQELIWLAKLTNHTILELRNANRPDRLNIEFYVTNKNNSKFNFDRKDRINNISMFDHVIELNENGRLNHHVLNKDEEKISLLTPNMKRSANINKFEIDNNATIDKKYNICKDYPLLGCRIRRGRPHWDSLLGYWAYLYSDEHLNLYCCGPKELTKLLKKKCKNLTQNTSTKFTFIHEGFT